MSVLEEEHMPELVRLKEISERLISPELAVKINEILPDALVVVNNDGHIVLFNLAAELMFGYARVEVLGGPVEALLPLGVRSKHAAEHRPGYMDDPRVRPMGNNLRLAGRNKNGKEFPVEINLAPVVTTDGTFVCAVVRRIAHRE